MFCLAHFRANVMSIELMGKAFELHFGENISWEFVALALCIDYEYFTMLRVRAEMMGFDAFGDVYE